MLFICKTVLKAGGQMTFRWCFWVTEEGQCNSKRPRKLEALYHLASQEDEVGCLIICCDEVCCVQKLSSSTMAQLLKSWFLNAPSRMRVLNTNWFTESKLPGMVPAQLNGLMHQSSISLVYPEIFTTLVRHVCLHTGKCLFLVQRNRHLNPPIFNLETHWFKSPHS